jgi:sec-independent protein translocase protein TatA
MGNLGATEIILIVLVIFVFFGAKKIPEMAKGFGQGIREFKKASREIQNENDDSSTAVGAIASASEASSCHYCRVQIQKDIKFCPACGKSQEPPKCPKCNSSNEFGNKFCSACGELLAN